VRESAYRDSGEAMAPIMSRISLGILDILSADMIDSLSLCVSSRKFNSGKWILKLAIQVRSSCGWSSVLIVGVQRQRLYSARIGVARAPGTERECKLWTFQAYSARIGVARAPGTKRECQLWTFQARLQPKLTVIYVVHIAKSRETEELQGVVSEVLCVDSVSHNNCSVVGRH
jgi:hypothetical protein